MSELNLERFFEPSNRMFDIALGEIKRGKKQSHWMWFIFPQIKGLGKSFSTIFRSSQTYGRSIRNFFG